jgi:hypothetical protein
MGEGEMREILSIHPCETSRVLLHAVKSYDMGPSRFTSHTRGRCAEEIFIAVKNTSPRPGLNPRPLGQVASTVTIIHRGGSRTRTHLNDEQELQGCMRIATREINRGNERLLSHNQHTYHTTGPTP